jgi:hypothetical protein
MPLNTNLKDLTPSRERYKKEIQLLSHGYYAQDKLPDGKIVVYPWDSKIDDWLVERSKTGSRETLLFETISKVCNLNGLSVGKLLVGDAMTILMVSRSMQHDFQIEYTAVCPACRAKEIATVKIPDQLGRVGEKTSTYKGHEDVTLPGSTDVVSVRPLFVNDEIAIVQRAPENRRALSDRTARIYTAIVAVNGGSPDDVNEVDSWYSALPPLDAAKLREFIEVVEPRLDTRINHHCDSCGYHFIYNLDINVDFFR